MARKAAREKAAAKAQAEREQAEAVQRLGRTTWRFVAAGDEDEDCFSLHIRGQKPESLGFLAATIDCTSWDLLNDYLRREQNFNVTDVKDKLMLSVKLEVDGEARYQQRVRDATELGTLWATCMDMGALIVRAQASRLRLNTRLTPHLSHQTSPHCEPYREPSTP